MKESQFTYKNSNIELSNDHQKESIKMEIPVSEDGIIMIAAKLYGTDSQDYKVFRDAAETRKERSKICIRYRELYERMGKQDDVFYYLSKEFKKSIDMIKKIIRKKHIYDRHEES